MAILILLVAGVIPPWRPRPRDGIAGIVGLTGAAVGSMIGRLALGILAVIGIPPRLGLPPCDGVAPWSWRELGGAPIIVADGSEGQGESSAQNGG